jgi:hypothetical protein
MGVTNTEIVRQLYAAFADRDIPRMLAMLAPDVEWGEPPNPYNPSAGTRRGHAGFLEWADIGRQAEDIVVLEPRKMLVDDDSVAVAGTSGAVSLRRTGPTNPTSFTA